MADIKKININSTEYDLTAARLNTSRYIDGVSFNGEGNVTRYTTCSTASGTAAKTASIASGTFNLATGARVTVKFTNANTASSPTLNIGGTGAKAIYWHGSVLSSSQYWQAGAVLDFIYNGTQWDLVSVAQDNNTTYGTGTSSTSGLTKLYTGTGTNTDGTMTQNAIKSALDGKANTTHSHKPSDISSGTFTNQIYMNTHPENSPLIIPFIYNDLAFLDKKGGSFKVYSTTSTDYTVASLTEGTVSTSSFGNAFDGSPSYATITTTGAFTAVIDLTLHKTFTYNNVFYIDFGSNNWRAKSISVYVMNSSTETKYTQKGSISDNTLGSWFLSMSHSSTDSSGTTVQGFDRIRIVLSDFNSTTSTTGKRIAQIGLINYGSAGVTETFISRGGCSGVYGSLVPQDNEALNLGSSSKKWLNVYAKNLDGNASSATKLATARNIKLTGDVTGSSSFDGSAEASIGATLSNSGVTAGSYGPSANASPAHQGTFSVPYITVDAKGRVTSASTKTITLPADNNTDTKVTNTLNTTTKAYITGTTSSSTNTGTQIFDTGVYLDTTAGRLGATSATIGGATIAEGASANIIGTTKQATTVSNQLVLQGGAVFSGTAAAAGLVTRGICGVSTPDADGACSKENLYINYDGANDYNSSRQVVLQAGQVGTHYGGNLYQYAAARGDAVKNWSEANLVTLSTDQTITGAKTFDAPSNVSGSEQTTAKFNTSNGGAIIFGKEGPNSGTMIRLDQADGTARLRFRASSTAGAMVWEQPEQGAQLYVDLGKDGADKRRIQFPSSAGTLELTGHKHSASDITTGTLAVARGGTGKTSVTSGNFLVGNGTSAMTEKTPKQVLSTIGAVPTSRTIAGVDLVDDITKNELNLALNNAIVITNNDVMVTTDTTKGTVPYNTSYGYTNITVNTLSESDLHEDLLLLFMCTGSLVVASATRNVRIRFGKSGQWIPLYYTTSIAGGSTYMATNQSRFIYYSTKIISSGAFHILTDNNSTYSPASLGFGYGTCSTAATTTAKVASLSSYALVTGGIVAVKFTYDVPASATLNINSKGAKAIYHNGAAITAGVIKAGDIATFVYSTQYHLVAINRIPADASSTTPKVAGTATVGSETAFARGDHVHPAQTSVSGNAGTATKLATARTLTIGNKGKSFNGSANVAWTLNEIGAAPAYTYGTEDLTAGTSSLATGTLHFVYE